MDLLRVPTRLGFPLLGDSKLDAHISLQSGLLGEAVPFHLLLVEEPRFVPSMSNEGLKRRPVSKNTKTQKYVKKQESEGEDQADTRPVGMMMSHNVMILPLHALGSIVEREESRRWVLRSHPLELRLTLRGLVAAPDIRAEGDPR